MASFLPTSSPVVVILKAICLILFARTLISASSGKLSIAALTTPGPETPTFNAHSGSPKPQKAPAINGLSPGELQKHTSFAAPIQSLSFVNSADFLIISAIFKTASIFIPALEDARLTEEHKKSVRDNASGILSIKSRSPFVHPFSTSAEKPPIKFTPTSLPAISRVWAIFT